MGRQGRTIAKRASGKLQASVKIALHVTGLDDSLDGRANMSEMPGRSFPAFFRTESGDGRGGEPQCLR